VAIKEMAPRNERDMASLQRKIANFELLRQNLGISTLIEVICLPSRVLLVMEWYGGGDTLENINKRGRLRLKDESEKGGVPLRAPRPRRGRCEYLEERPDLGTVRTQSELAELCRGRGLNAALWSAGAAPLRLKAPAHPWSAATIARRARWVSEAYMMSTVTASGTSRHRHCSQEKP
jgi:hypothetical protein